MNTTIDPPGRELLEIVQGHAFDTQDECEAVLNVIRSMLSGHLGDGRQDTDEAFAAIHSWAGLMSYAVINTYAPQSRMRFPTWSRGVSDAVLKASDLLRRPVEWVAVSVGASGYSIGVAFPWGVSVALTWPPRAGEEAGAPFALAGVTEGYS